MENKAQFLISHSNKHHVVVIRAKGSGGMKNGKDESEGKSVQFPARVLPFCVSLIQLQGKKKG